jgi:DNA-binding SARP family transcriptional activator/tetratricopeptide (TPR) repeat protein
MGEWTVAATDGVRSRTGGGDLTVGVLGPLRVAVDGRPVALTTPRLRALLAIIAMAAGQGVPSDRLATALWDGDPPDNVRKAVQNYVTRLRAALGGQVIDTIAAGYVLRISPDQVDALRFLRLLDDARRAADPAAERALLVEALAQWRGQPFEDVQAPWLHRSEGSRLIERHLAATERRIDLELATGPVGEDLLADLVAEVAELAGRHPLRESLWLRLLLVLERSGRRAEALERYGTFRVRLADELGVDPGPELQRAHAALVAGSDLDLEPAPEPVRPQVSGNPPPVVPRQLPAGAGHFTGREEAVKWVAELADMVDVVRPVVSAIAGAAGVGKSALAIHAAHVLAPHFPDGQLYVDLQAATPGLEPLAPLEVLGRFLRGLGVPGAAVPREVDEAAAAFRSRTAGLRLLVVLDNAADVAQIRPLLPAGPDCAVLVTSRSLLTALDSARHLRLEGLAPAEAVELLRVLAGGGRVEADPEGAAEVAGWCEWLPLALRIAGARLAARPNWPLRALAARLADAERRLDELELAGSGARVSFAVSYEQLRTSQDPVDRNAARVFTLLGVLDGPDVAAPVVGRLLDEADTAADTAAEPALERLVDVQLLESRTVGRYHLHDLLRLYARELAGRESGDLRTAALTRVAEFYTATAWQASSLVRRGDYRTARMADRWQRAGLPFADDQAALAWLDAERANIVAAVFQAARDPGVPDELIVQLASMLYAFFMNRSHWTDWLAVNEAALAAARRAGDLSGQAQMHNDLAAHHWRVGDYDAALACLEESLTIRRTIGDRRAQGACLTNLGLVYLEQGRDEQALAYLQESLAFIREVDDSRFEANTLGILGKIYLRQGRYDEALPCLERSLAIYRELGDRSGQAISLNNLGEVYVRRGDAGPALPYLTESLESYGEIGDRRGQALTLVILGIAHRQEGRHEEALACLRKSLEIQRQIGYPKGQTESLTELGITLRDLGRTAEARAHLQEAMAIFEQQTPTADVSKVRTLLSQLPHRALA